MRFLSLFSGIEAASTAWADLGWECVGFSEIEPFPCELLAQRHPGVPNLGDVTKITETDILMLGQIDLVVFGSTCQDLSVAGNRKGLEGARSGLFFTALRIVEWAREWGDCRFALWENVPGAFSSNSGRDFASVVDALAGVDGTTAPPKGWGNEGCAVGPEAMVEWATLDAQWFGVAQRRRRVFALADFGDWSSRPPILLESESLRGDTAPRREAGESVAGTFKAGARSGGWSNSVDHAAAGYMVPVAGTLSARNKGGGGLGTDFDLAGGLVPERRPVLTSTGDVAHCLNAGGMGRIDYETETFVLGFNSNAQPDEMTFDPHTSAALTCSQSSAIAIHPHAIGRQPHHGPQGKEYLEDGSAYCMDGRGSAQAVAYGIRTANTSSNGWGIQEEPTHTLDRAMGIGVAHSRGSFAPMAVRRLTPTEAEKLQGFPVGYTAIQRGTKPAADSVRYRALGNSMAVPVMAWIGRQIDFAVRFF